MKNTLAAVEFVEDHVRLINQTKLPDCLKHIEVRSASELAKAIYEMKVRGAPALGVAAGYCFVLAVQRAKTLQIALEECEKAKKLLVRTGRGAANLHNAIRIMRQTCESNSDSLDSLKAALRQAADRIAKFEREASEIIREKGASYVRDCSSVLTVCNTGMLVGGVSGTALGLIVGGWIRGLVKRILVCETRPRLQGSRLTAWELTRHGIPHTIIPDGAASYAMHRENISAVVVGADLVALNGDFANKIGTYALAVAAKEHGIDFYVVAPTSTVDPRARTRGDIENHIESRSPDEVLSCMGKHLKLSKLTSAINWAHDTTPAGMITGGLITEKGLLAQPFALDIRTSLGLV